MATFSSIEPSETLWYPDSAAVSHMMPYEGILFSMTSYHGFAKVLDRDAKLLPIANLGNRGSKLVLDL